MKIGLIDVDSHNFPNLALMKLSAWHKEQGDQVEWYEPLIGGHYNRVYVSKVFGFTEDYQWPINADEIIRGGTGYDIQVKDGREQYTKGADLFYLIEHIYPDYSLYGIGDTAYGFMTRGCPRGCDFCIVGKKEGRQSCTVAPLKEFWRGQREIVLLDPNPIAAKEWRDNFQQLIDSKARVEFNQGVDIRLMTEEKAQVLSQIKCKWVHFAWDRYQDKDKILPKLKMFKKISGWDRNKLQVYVLTNFDTTLDQDLERIYTLRDMGYAPYVMIYDKQGLPKGSIYKALQRYVNNRYIFYSAQNFESYLDIQGIPKWNERSDAE